MDAITQVKKEQCTGLLTSFEALSVSPCPESAKNAHSSLSSLTSPTPSRRCLPSRRRLLYVDCLNFATRFCGSTSTPGVWNITASFERVKKFVKAAERSQITLKCFLGDTAPSEEATMKFNERREKEIRSGEKRVPQGLAVLLGEMFREAGVEVYYSDNVDNDDTLASYAQHDEADVLSGDKDMFRYIGSTFVVYDNFYENEQGELRLRKKRYVKIPEEDLRRIEPLPTLKDRVSNIFGAVFKRGTVTCLTRRLSISPHRVVTPLRRALFKSLGLTGPITEQWPEWVNNRVEWHIESDIYPETFDDEHMLGLLQRPDDAFEHFKDALLGTNDESQLPPSIEKGCTALEIEMTKVNEDIHTLKNKITSHQINAPEGEASQILHEKQGRVLDDDLRRLEKYKKSLIITEDEWNRHQFCVRSLVYELCVSRPGDHQDTLLNYWLLRESKSKKSEIV